ncbi:MAG: lipopolysaccharide assembly protein LapB [Gammaproteobacteria bacterium]|nr:lipopolysaccharide assembly protein LapB [Gammaproteobacteria bacterium]
MPMFYELVWLLLPVAAASGWLAASRSARNRLADEDDGNLSRAEYFRGLNLLLNEQPDKAIEVFVEMLEVDSDTVETHMALGSLFRRRGEVDRAIRIHQNVVARDGLSPQERGEALLELGDDYMRAGLLDRAEALFRELIQEFPVRERALQRLTEIYQQEKDWDRAVESTRELELATGRSYNHVIAHYFCEKAEEAARRGALDDALECIGRAVDISSQCVRASLVEGRIYCEKGDPKAALRAYKRVERQCADYLPEVIGPMNECFKALDQPAEMSAYLEYVLERYGGITATLTLANLKAREEGDVAAIDFLTEQMRRRPSVRGLDHLIALARQHVDGQAEEYLSILKDLTGNLLEDRPVYKCHHCGFSGKTLHWQCPSCKAWGAVKPIQGVEGE